MVTVKLEALGKLFDFRIQHGQMAQLLVFDQREKGFQGGNFAICEHQGVQMGFVRKVFEILVSWQIS